MNTVYWINIIVFTVTTVPYAINYIIKNKLTPVSTFLIMEASMFYGICFYRGDTSVMGFSEVGVKLETMYTIALIFFIFGVERSKKHHVKRTVLKTPQNRGIENDFYDWNLSTRQRRIIWLLVIMSCMACAYLFIMSGTNLLVEALKDTFRSNTNVYRDERMAFGSIPGIGYVYQFRVVILPILATYFALAEKRKKSFVFRCALYIFMIFCLLCTGQRNAFAFYVLILFFYILEIRYSYNIVIVSKRGVIVFGAMAFVLLAIMTIANGRVSDYDNMYVAVIKSVVDRVLFVNQGSALTAFSYINSQEIVWGYDWWEMFLQILPGKIDYVPVDNISYFIEYGTYEGTNPPCLWGSGWYNFGIFGITVYPFIIGFCYQRLYMKIKKTVNKDRLYVLFYVALCVYLGIWVYGTPMALFNQGIITVLIMRWFIYKYPQKRILV